MADVPGNSNVGSIKSTESVEDVANMDEQPQQFPTAPSYTQPQDMTFSNILAMTQATHNMSRGVAQNIATGFPPYMMGINPALANRAVAPPGSRSINPALANKAVAPQGSRSINPALANRAVAPQGSRSNPGQTNAAPVYINQGRLILVLLLDHVDRVYIVYIGVYLYKCSFVYRYICLFLFMFMTHKSLETSVICLLNKLKLNPHRDY